MTTTIQGGNRASILNGGAGNDVIADYTEGKDKIKLSGTVITKTEFDGDDVIFTTDNGTLTVKNSKSANITVEGATTQIYTENAIYNSKFTEMTLFDSASGTITADSKLKSIDATAATNAIKIIGNSQANTIIGGNNSVTIEGSTGNDSILGGKGTDSLYGEKGNDTLTGGDGADVFVYSAGKDVITDFSATEDSIELSAGTISSASVNGSDMVFKIGSGTLTVKNGKNTEFNFDDIIYYNDLIYDSEKTEVTFGKAFDGTLAA